MIPDERVLLAVIVRVLLMAAALWNLRRSYQAYRFYRDARGLRGFAAAVTILAGVLALATSSAVIRDEYPVIAQAMRIGSTASIVAFLIGVVFSAVSWRYGR